MIHIYICIYIYIHTHTQYTNSSLSLVSFPEASTCLSNFLFCNSAWISNIKHSVSKTEILILPSMSASFSLPHLRQWQFYLLVSQVTHIAVTLASC